MKVQDCTTSDYTTLETDTSLGRVRAVFDDSNPKTILLTEDGDYRGIIREKQLVQSHIQHTRKAGSMMQSAPRLDPHDNIRDAARELVEADVSAAPVFAGEKLKGVVTRDTILQKTLDNLDVLDVSDVASENVVTIEEEQTIGEAIYELRENGISRLPVLDKSNKLVGILTTHDIIGMVVRDMDKATHGDRSGDIERMLDIPVETPMTSPVTTTRPQTSVKTAVRTMLDDGYGGVVVTEQENPETVVGILTKTDVLRALSYKEQHNLDVQITNVDLLDTLSREAIYERVENIAGKYQDMRVRHAHVRFHKHSETRRDTPLIRAQIRLRTNRGQAAGTGEGYGAGSAFRVAADKLERNVLDIKNTRTDEERSRDVLRGLGDL